MRNKNWAEKMKKMKEDHSKKGQKKNSYKDDRFYFPEKQDNGRAEAVIRFLDSPDTDLPYVTVREHSFKENSLWLIKKCPRTLGRNENGWVRDCPVCVATQPLWDTDRDLAARRGARTYYVGNILVVDDPAHPENNGKVFLFRYGKTIYDLIMEKIDPPEDSKIQKPCNVFEEENGANFNLIVKWESKGGRPRAGYSSSNFDSPSAIGTADEIAMIEKGLYNLKEFIDPKQFDSWDNIKERFEQVTGETINGGTAQPQRQPSGSSEGSSEGSQSQSDDSEESTPPPADEDASEAPQSAPEPSESVEEEYTEDDVNFFAGLKNKKQKQTA